MKTAEKQHIPKIRATASSMLPGMYQARFMLSLSIRMLEYLDRHLVCDAKTDSVTVNAPAPEDLRKDVRQLLSLICLFESVQKQPS